VVGLMNTQFAVKGQDIYVLEVNPRASRTVPFVAKATGVPIAKIAARVMAGERLADFGLVKRHHRHTAVKEAVFPFARFPGVDVILGPEMKSTGEVMGLDFSFARAFAKSQLGAGLRLPVAGTVFVSVKDKDKEAMIEPCQKLAALGFRLLATAGTAEYLAARGITVERINKVHEGRPHIVDAMKDGWSTHLQYRRGIPGDGRQFQPPPGGPSGQYRLLHDGSRCARLRRRDRRSCQRRA
jgi:Carbamoylphosphate synthase large subunit (split gene in MJ)